MNLEIANVKIKEATLDLTQQQGEQIKELIQEFYCHSHSYYCIKVGIKTPNFYTCLNGTRSCTLSWLRKLMSGIKHEVELSGNTLVFIPMDTAHITTDIDELILRELDHASADPDEE